MSIDGMWEKYGDRYILNHADGNRYVRWGKIEDDLDSLPTLEAKLQVAVEAALTYQTLCTCYRLGKQPTETLFNKLSKANKFLEKNVKD